MRPVRCGGPELPEYAVGRLPAVRAREWDRHLVSCTHCRARAAQERELQQRLIAVPEPSSALRAQLLAMSWPDARSSAATEPAATVRTSRVPELALMAPTAPAAHRSARRAVALASAVAGAGATAVWAFGLVGAPVSRPVSGGAQSASPAVVLLSGVQASANGLSHLGGASLAPFTATPATWTTGAVASDSAGNPIIDRAEFTP